MMETITDIPAQLYVDPKRREELELVLEKDGLVQRFHCQLFRKDGSKIWLSTSARAIQQGDALATFRRKHAVSEATLIACG